MNLVDGHRRRQRLALAALFHPLGILPLVPRVPDDAGGTRRRLVEEADRVELVHRVVAVARRDVVLVLHPLAGAGDERLPDAGLLARVQWVTGLVPAVEVADDADVAGRRRPDGEVDALDAVDDAL